MSTLDQVIGKCAEWDRCCSGRRTITNTLCRVLLSAAILTATLIRTVPVYAQGGKPSLEYQVKASMIFNFLQFVEWPAEELARFPSLLPICLNGENRFGSALGILERELVKGRRIQFNIVRGSSPDRYNDCLAVFVGSDQDANLPEILRLLDGRSVLTIGESDRFLENGGIINLSVVGGRVTFEVNRSAALGARLELSSRLLRIAHEVRG